MLRPNQPTNEAICSYQSQIKLFQAACCASRDRRPQLRVLRTFKTQVMPEAKNFENRLSSDSTHIRVWNGSQNYFGKITCLLPVLLKIKIFEKYAFKIPHNGS